MTLRKYNSKIIGEVYLSDSNRPETADKPIYFLDEIILLKKLNLSDEETKKLHYAKVAFEGRILG